jgi:hypothetical protein
MMKFLREHGANPMLPFLFHLKPKGGLELQGAADEQEEKQPGMAASGAAAAGGARAWMPEREPVESPSQDSNPKP